MDEAPVLLDPQLELRLELEDADEDRHAERRRLCAASRSSNAVEVGRAGQRLAGAEAGLIVPARQVDGDAIEELPSLGVSR